MPDFISIIFRRNLIGKKLLVEFTRLPLRENTFSIAINIIPNSKSRFFPFNQIAFIRSKSFFINRFLERFMSKPK